MSCRIARRSTALAITVLALTAPAAPAQTLTGTRSYRTCTVKRKGHRRPKL